MRLLTVIQMTVEGSKLPMGTKCHLLRDELSYGLKMLLWHSLCSLCCFIPHTNNRWTFIQWISITEHFYVTDQFSSPQMLIGFRGSCEWIGFDARWYTDFMAFSKINDAEGSHSVQVEMLCYLASEFPGRADYITAFVMLLWFSNRFSPYYDIHKKIFSQVGCDATFPQPQYST